MEFNKNELHMLNVLSLYKALAIVYMVFGIVGIPFGLYLRSSRWQACAYLNNALIGASIAVLGLGYILYCFVKLVGVFKRGMTRTGQGGSP